MAGPKTPKVNKSSSSSNPSSAGRMTRSMSKRASSVSSSGLQNMVDEVANRGSFYNKQTIGRTKLLQISGYEDQLSQAASRKQQSFHAKLQPDEDEFQHFRLMDLPAEVRLEIYRACLVRPQKVRLSKIVKEVVVEEQPEMDAQPHDLQVLSDDSTAEESNDLNPASASRSTRSAAHRGSPGRQAAKISKLKSIATPESTAPSHPNVATTSPAAGNAANTVTKIKIIPDHRLKDSETLVINILRVSKLVYKEARDILYSENVFDLDIFTAGHSLNALHQRSRRHIKHVELEIPSYAEILERFADLVRLSLRYCTGLKTFVIRTPFTLPGAAGSTSSMSVANTTVYANGFDILRWLPQQCRVILDGNKSAEIEAVVEKHMSLARVQNQMAYERRKLISSESD